MTTTTIARRDASSTDLAIMRFNRESIIDLDNALDNLDYFIVRNRANLDRDAIMRLAADIDREWGDDDFAPSLAILNSLSY